MTDMTNRFTLRIIVILGLTLALGIVKLLQKILGSRVWLVLVLIAVIGVAVRFGACDLIRPVRIGTYNIRRFGVENTDLRRLATVVEDSRADVLALQEIQSEARLRDLVRRLSREERAFDFVLSRCGGRSEMRVGFLFDTKRLVLHGTREFPELALDESGRCDGERPGLLGTFSRRGRDTRFQLLVVHLVAGGEPDKVEKRKAQWRLAHRIARSLRDDGPVAIVGDTNSTGYLDDGVGERTFIEQEAQRAGMVVETRSLGCSEYFQPDPPAIRPSLLDHFVGTPDLARPGSARIHGYCAELVCKPAPSPPQEFTSVSDHCPVTLDLQ